MKIKGVTVSINYTTIKNLVNRIRLRKKKYYRRVDVEERIIVHGIKYRIYDADDDTFKAIRDDEITGMAEQHKPV